ncbi:hypothetical protein DFH09DRAFT_1335686 [Mycena vulgaris]|nr:hypothetical protein DFH09DRAFT_1335686 [Mycena vulgaris]
MHGPPTSDMMYRRPASTSTPVSAAQNPSNLRCAVANPDTTYPLPATDAPPAHQLPPLHATQNPQIFRCVPRAHQSLPARPSGFLIERRHDEFPPTTHHFWLQLPARLGHAISPHLRASNSRNAIVTSSPLPSESHPPRGSAAINTAELKLHVWASGDRPQRAITALAAAVAPQKFTVPASWVSIAFPVPVSVLAVVTPPARARDPQRTAPFHIQSLDFAFPRARVHVFRAPTPRRAITAPPLPPQHPDGPTITPSMHRRAPHLNFGFRVPASQIPWCCPPQPRHHRINVPLPAPISKFGISRSREQRHVSCPHHNAPALHYLIFGVGLPASTLSRSYSAQDISDFLCLRRTSKLRPSVARLVFHRCSNLD